MEENLPVSESQNLGGISSNHDRERVTNPQLHGFMCFVQSSSGGVSPKLDSVQTVTRLAMSLMKAPEETIPVNLCAIASKSSGNACSFHLTGKGRELLLNSGHLTHVSEVQANFAVPWGTGTLKGTIVDFVAFHKSSAARSIELRRSRLIHS